MYSQKSWLTYVHSPSGAWCVGHSILHYQESLWGASTKSSKGTRTDNDMDAVWFLIAVSCITVFPSCIKRTCTWGQHQECLFSQTSVLIVRFFKSYFSFPISLNMYWIHNEAPHTRSKGGSPHLSPWCLWWSPWRRKTEIWFLPDWRE